MKKLLIELYEPFEFDKNVYQAFLTDAEHLLYLSPEKVENRERTCLTQFIRDELPHIQTVAFRQLDFVDLERELDKLVEGYDEVVVDTFGGDSLLAVALYRYAIQRGMAVIAMDVDKNYIYQWMDNGIEKTKCQVPSLTISQLIALHGGKILRYHQDPISRHYFSALKELAAYAFRYPRKWLEATQFFSMADTVDLVADTAKVFTWSGRTYRYPQNLIPLLRAAGMLHVEMEDKKRVRYLYPNPEAQLLCRTKGYILELYLYILAEESGLFDECYLGVEIDWNGIFPEVANVQNEIDLILRKGRRTVFVSCKMTDLTAEAVNELDLYAEHFMGDDCLKVMVCTGKISPTIYQRCQEYGVLVIGLADVDKFILQLKRHLRAG